MPKSNSGFCYRQSFEHLMRNPWVTLVHGIVTNPSGRKVVHAWIEYTNTAIEFVYDASVQINYLKSTFYGGYRPENIHKYSYPAAVLLSEDSEMYGPWDSTSILFLEHHKIPAISDTPKARQWREEVKATALRRERAIEQSKTRAPAKDRSDKNESQRGSDGAV